MENQSTRTNGKTQKFPAPKPMELAKLAAMLSRPHAASLEAADEERRRAFQRAMEFYVEAVCLVDELPTDPAHILANFGSYERNKDSLAEGLSREWRWNKLILETSKDGDDSDEVRRFLKDKGFKFKLARSVLNWFRRIWEANREANPQKHQPANVIIESMESTTENGEKIYRFTERMLEVTVTLATQRTSESKRRAWRTRKK